MLSVHTRWISRIRVRRFSTEPAPAGTGCESRRSTARESCFSCISRAISFSNVSVAVSESAESSKVAAELLEEEPVAPVAAASADDDWRRSKPQQTTRARTTKFVSAINRELNLSSEKIFSQILKFFSENVDHIYTNINTWYIYKYLYICI